MRKDFRMKKSIALIFALLIITLNAYQEPMIPCRQIKAHLNRPKIELRKQKSVSADRYVIDCDFSVIVDKVLAENWKVPIVRLVVMIEDINPNAVDKYLVCEALFKEVNSSEASISTTYNQEFGTQAAEQSYRQRFYSGSAKKLMYFERKPMAKGDATKDYTSSPWKLDAKDVEHLKIKGYRVECWQNGELIDVVDKLDKDWLKKRKLPLDWYMMYFHKETFKYNSLKKMKESFSTFNF